MHTELSPRPALPAEHVAAPVPAPERLLRRRWPAYGVAALAFLLAIAGIVSVAGPDGEGAARVQAGPSPSESVPVAVLGEVESASPQSSVPPPVAASVPQVATTLLPATTTAGPAPASRTVSEAPASPVCRNSTDPACGVFRFDPQPGPDRPMSVEVVAEPSSARVGQPVVFHLTLRDPDGVSYGASTFSFGDSGIGETSTARCSKYGPWEPPAPDPSRATEAQDLRHTYSQPGTYTASFSFDAGPYDCVDSTSGRGDRPYASSASGGVTVVVRP